MNEVVTLQSIDNTLKRIEKLLEERLNSTPRVDVEKAFILACEEMRKTIR